MLFEDIITINQPDNKKIEKHIKLNPALLVALNNIQIAYKIETKQHINLNELVSIGLNLLIKELKKEIARTDNYKTIVYLQELKREFIEDV